MRNSLDQPLDIFEDWLQRASKILIDTYKSLDKSNAYSGLQPHEAQKLFDEVLPQRETDFESILSETRQKVIENATLNIGPNMYAYVMAGGTQVSVIAELLAAGINQNGGKWHLSPALTEIEKRVIQWGASFIGYSENTGGSLTSGGSAANLTCLDVAKTILLGPKVKREGLFGMAPATVYASTEVHGCIDKSMEHLGLGSDNLRKIPVDDDFRINLDHLKRQLAEDVASGYMPLCVIGSAGTVNTGAVDPLPELADIAKANNMWFHIDGAYGGLAASLPQNKDLFTGIEKADSIAIDFHKWLYQPFEGGCAMFKNWDVLRDTYKHHAAYLSTDANADNRVDLTDYSFPLSRNFKGLKIWMSFKTYGAEKLRWAIEKDIANTTYLGQLIEEAMEFELASRPALGIVTFRYLGGNKVLSAEEIDELNRKIIPALEKDRRVFITGTTIQSRPVIRACLINHRQQKIHVEFLLQVIREVGQQITERLPV